ncbi:hypothetical protein LK542_04520 [Massilia sp. IC2-477]|uniref:hypothetical protein n=1 Tax=Massilia sp. IC2-477 TaxID=2887198 RepID=UPI001D0FD74D|nr:hypothetical protein [Massilia sp. IC2-477]MCC2954878.1 hypothetical protein [Massilia sp. IC2-477]
MKPLHVLLALALACPALAAQAAPLRDPFARPPAQPAPPPSSDALDTDTLPVLRAIMVDARQSMANIGGHIVSVGDQVGPYHVLRIDERSVTLLRGKTKNVLAIDRTPDRGSNRESSE